MPSHRLPAVLLGLYLLLLLGSAWVHDDAYITFRTVDNFVHGLGLTWNPGERVQAYTHPLWMFLHSALYAVTGDVYFTTLALSIILSATAFSLLVFRAPVSLWGGALAGVLLVSSKSFVEYSTSGLENPLTHFLLVVFALVWFRDPESPDLFSLSLIAALACLNRPDALLLYLPALGYPLLRRPAWRPFLKVALGLSPVAAWEVFSVVYYGFLVPNTAYAKLGLGAPRSSLLAMGGTYLFYTLVNDPVTWLGLALAAYAVVRRRALAPGLLMAGAGLYLGYVVWIGGDYMGGRFLSAPVLVAAVALARWDLPEPTRRQALAGLAVLGLLVARTAVAPLTSSREMQSVGDERVRFYHATGLTNALFSNRTWPDHFFRRKGEYVHRHGPPLVVDAYVGMLGYYAGPGIYVVDLMGLPDPLLSRLPGRFRDDRTTWKPGHVSRPLPEGYLETLKSGRNLIADPDLAAYYDKIVRVTRGRLWDRERWRDILRFHTGAYRGLVESYVDHNPGDFVYPSGDLRALFTIDEGAVIREMP